MNENAYFAANILRQLGVFIDREYVIIRVDRLRFIEETTFIWQIILLVKHPLHRQ